MKLVVIGGSGLIGSKLVSILRSKGHEVLPASPDSGVNTITGEGVDAALAGAQVVVDVSNVCYSAELPPHSAGPQRPYLDRLSTVVGAWRRRYGADAPIRCVVDTSVSEQVDLRRQPLARELAIEVTPYADEIAVPDGVTLRAFRPGEVLR